MEFAAETPRLDFEFKGFKQSVPQPWKAGDTLTEQHAKFINRQFASVTGNIFSSALNRLVAKAEKEEAAKAKAENRAAVEIKLENLVTADKAVEMFNAILAEYEPGVTTQRGDGILKDPVQQIADNIAWTKIKARLGELKIKVSSVTAEKKAEFIAQYHAKDPSIMALAKQQYEGANANTAMDDMFASLTATDTNAAPAGDDTTSGDAGTDSVSGDATSDTVEGGTASDTPTPEIAPDASAGEPTPSGGAFA